jgi:hypothetical protein
MVDVDGVEALGAPASHHSAAVMVVDVEGWSAPHHPPPPHHRDRPHEYHPEACLDLFVVIQSPKCQHDQWFQPWSIPPVQELFFVNSSVSAFTMAWTSLLLTHSSLSSPIGGGGGGGGGGCTCFGGMVNGKQKATQLVIG